jgi:type I restriction enzyme M protein
MVEVLDPREGEVIGDPCCGSGGFLIKAFEYVRAKIEADIHESKEKIKLKYYTADYEKLSDEKQQKVDAVVNALFSKLNGELDINREESRIRRLSFDCIFGTDANPRMARTSKMNMIMHGDGHGGVHHNDGLLNVNGIFDNRFDVILTNPPFGARVEKTLKITEADKYTDEARINKYRERYGEQYDNALNQINENIGNSVLSLYETGKLSGLTEVLFIERCLNLLKPGGRMGIVLPEGVLNNANLQNVRDYFESIAKIILITSIPQDVFVASGATVKPSLLFFRKFTLEEKVQWEEIVNDATQQVHEKYAKELESIKVSLALKGVDAIPADKKKKLTADMKRIEQQMSEERRSIIKDRFDYQIPIAEIEKAGISTTGAACDNELESLAIEFTAYRKENNLWKESGFEVHYNVKEEKLFRIAVGEGPVEIYGK